MKDIAYEEFIERLREESDIVAIISEYVSLKKNGKNYWGCCPFHSEKTASFSVTPDKGFFYCFGCQAGGNVFNFIMKIENITFFEATRMLAQKINLPLPQKEKTKEELLRDKQISLLYKINATAKDFFFACLTKTNYGKSATAYLKKRGLSDEVINEFQLGFAPNYWDKLSQAFVKRGFTETDLLQAGLVLERKQGGIYDRFRNRVIFPITDEKNRVIGFGGRVLDDSLPKYLNSPETVVFNKRQTLFGLAKAGKYIKEKNQALIVEGYMDVISAYNAGIKNVIASLGTSFTVEHGKKLLKYTDNFIFAYDSDNAGQNATLRALAIVKKIGAKVKVLSIPDGKDPDDYIKKYGGYLIGMKRTWGKSNGLAPVWYCDSESTILNAIIDRYNQIEVNIKNGKNFTISREIFLYTLSHIKNYEGQLIAHDFNKYRFYDEREFRSVPRYKELKKLHPTIQPYLSEKDYQDYKRKHKNTLIKTLKLSFEWEDIRYIVVKRKQDIKTISELLQNLAPDIHPQIFTTQQILEDVIGCNHNRQLSISDAK